MSLIHVAAARSKPFPRPRVARASVQDSRLIGCSHEDNAAVVH